MSKILSIFIVLIGIITASHAAAPTTPTVYGPTDYECIYSWNILTQSAPTGTGYNPGTVVKDTLNGQDSISFVTKYPLQPGWEYFLQIKDSTGTADSFKVRVDVYGFDGSTLMNTAILDTLGGATTYKCIGMPFSTIGYGQKVTIKLVKWIATLKAKVYRAELMRRQPHTNKLW